MTVAVPYGEMTVALAQDPLDVIGHANRMIAVCSRYGRIDVSDWPMSEARGFALALNKLLDDEKVESPEDHA